MAARIVVFSGAGISAESGLKTFRDSGGLWEGYSIEEVATPDAWQRNPELVQRFYNERRKAMLEAIPNAAHLALAELESRFKVSVVTQNVDNLHERAGSSFVLHLHGELGKSRSTRHPELVYEVQGSELRMGDLCERGAQLRPHIVWFGEAVPLMEEATRIGERADVLIVEGTSLVVYPAAGLVEYAPRACKKYVVDRKIPKQAAGLCFECIEANAVHGVPALVKELLGEGAH